MTLSIIIPVYNVEKYIRGTLESILSKSLEPRAESLEIIVVDDETPDNSMQIVEEFAAIYENIRIIHQKNKGLSGARNTGLEAAQGEFVWFMDSDDRATENALEVIFKNLSPALSQMEGDCTQIDMFGFGIYTEDEDTGHRRYFAPLSWYRGEEPYGRVVDYMTMGNHTMGPTARYVFRREFLMRTGLRFWEGALHEDVDFLNKAFFFARGIWLSKEPTYIYLERSSGSIMSTVKMKSFYDLLKICRSFENLSPTHPKGEGDCKKKLYWDLVMWRTVTIMQNANMRGHGLAESDVEEYRRFMKANRGYFVKLTIRGIIASLRTRAWKDVLLGVKGLW